MLVFSILMIISNIALLRHESVRVQNILGLGIGFVLIFCEAFGAWLLMQNVSGSEMQVRVYYTLSSVYYTVFTYFLRCCGGEWIRRSNSGEIRKRSLERRRS